MKFETINRGNWTLIDVKSEKLDNTISPLLKSHLVVLNAEGVKNIVINLEQTRYCDSSGLSAILVANRLCKNSGGTFILAHIQDTIKKLISISQLDSILQISASVNEAEQQLNNTQAHNN
jgi:anti-sigma B factor antagonist